MYVDGRFEYTHSHGSTEGSYQGVLRSSRPGLPLGEGFKKRRDRRNSIMLAKTGSGGGGVKIFPKLFQKVKTKRSIFNISLKQIWHWNLNLIGKECIKKFPSHYPIKTICVMFPDKILTNRIYYYAESIPHNKVVFIGVSQTVRKLEVRKSKMYAY